MEDARIVHGYRPMVWDLKPPQFKSYPDHDSMELPESLEAGPDLDVRAISRLLFLSGGVVRLMDVMGKPMWFRAAGSAGNLSPLELYVVTGGLKGLEAGVYHYEPVDHALTFLSDVAAGTPTSLVLTGVQWRTSWKYRERGFRHLWWDAGTMLAQSLAVCEDAGWPGRVELGFVDAELAALTGAQVPMEVPLAILALGNESQLPAATQDAQPGYLATRWVEFPLATAAYRAGELRSTQEVGEWRTAMTTVAARPATDQSAWAPSGDIAEIIRRRGSTRDFDPRDVAPNDLLNGGMGWSTRSVPGDFVSAGCTLLEQNLIVHAVDGTASGTYRWNGGALEPLKSGDLRSIARHLCLDQPLGGDGAYTAFHSADVAAVTAAAGDRAYRCAQLEAGIVEGRLHLAAYSMGYGATGLTFYDDEVKAFFDTRADPMLVTSVGRPAYQARPGGLPRRPLTMRGS